MSTAAPPWEGIIPREEIELYREIGLGATLPGGGLAGLLVIDVQYRSVGHRPAPIREAIREYPTSCGEYGWRAVPHIRAVLEAFREAGMPVVFAHVAPKKSYDGGRWADKAPAVMGIPARGYDFVEEVAPRDNEILLPKQHASAFFGTPLASYLVNLGVSTLFVTGTTTSGCVRATAVDASSFGFRVIVPQECVFDRSQVSHAVNLFDMNSKYADVVPVEEALARLDRLAGLARPAERS
ncbi:MAG TPA: isochorismatase family protein [Ramlibacter sp.]|uniref:isochorismatase family protein n=1 Tax=Ramlibacter sp. TaxID=1917967 RepID=UPI002C11CBC8|nr:isochorismatase family protein [Ramlibacter sp.]HVZ43556.1 isochorismatase family protein [Ramlibacter sp.]